jgi:hypothetical protein
LAARHAAISCRPSGKQLPPYFDQTTYMSINSVSRSLLPYYGPLAGANSSPAARAAALPDEPPLAAPTREAVTPAASPGGEVESALERALRQARIATETAKSGESDPESSGRNAPAISLYRRVSQYSDDRSSASGLMKSWNDIVRENQFDDAGVASHLRAAAQNDAVVVPSRILHLTA